MMSRETRLLRAVHARNLTLPFETGNNPTASTSQTQALLGPFCFVTFRSSGDAPFYVTPIACGHQASWGEYSSAPIFPDTDFQPWARRSSSELLVGLYLSDDPESHWECAWEVEVDLRSFNSLGLELGAVRETQSNCVYLGLAQGDADHKLEYVAVHQRQTPNSDMEEVSRRALQLSLVETQMRQSYSFAQACSLIHIEGDLIKLRQTSGEIRDRCSALITGGHLFDKRQQLESRHSLKDLRHRLHTRKHELMQARASLLQSRNKLEDCQADLQRGLSLQKEAEEQTKQIQEATISVSERNEAAQREIQSHRARLLRDIEFIYPIELVNARDLLYSILGIDLPNGVATTDPKSGALIHKKHLEQSAAALNYVAQIVLLLSFYLHTSLPYPMRPLAGRLTLLDTISVMKGPRRFGLYGKGTEPYRYEYGVFLLNKNLVRLMHAYHVPVLDLRNTLPNVKNLLMTLASIQQDAPSTRIFMVVVCRPRETGDTRMLAPDTLGYAEAYQRILSIARKRVLGEAGTEAIGGAAVLVVTTPEVDSLAAARVLTRLLADDQIAFRIAPVNGYRSLHEVLSSDVEGRTELHTLIFLNLGSLMPLPTLIPIPPNCVLHVFDSHRPWNLSNLFATSHINDQIFVWDDGEIEERLVREREAYEMLEFDIDSDLEDESASESESESNTDLEEEGLSDEPRSSDDTPADQQHRKRTRAQADDSPQKRSRHLDSDQRQVYRAILAKYYSRGSWTGMSIAQMMYLLAVALGRSDRDSLWYAIIGLTSQFVNNAIHTATYEGYAAALASDVVALNPTEERPLQIRGLQDVNRYGADDQAIRVNPEELRFILYRHWSLETSMYHTSYVAAKLGIWREQGISKLRGLLAKMGLSLANCRQTYEHMDIDLKNSLVHRMESIAPEYGLTDLVFQSFTRSFGFRSMPMNASDTVEGVAALLQAAHGVRVEVEGVQVLSANPSSSTRASDTAPDRGTATYGARHLWSLDHFGMHVGARGLDVDASSTSWDQDENKPNAMWVQNFFEAYRALDTGKVSSIELLQRSLQLAKALHQAIVAQGVGIIVKQSIKTLKSFRFTVLQEGPQLNLFVHPDTLTRLGYWLIDALRDIVTEQNQRRAFHKRDKQRNGSHSSGENTQTPSPTSLPYVLAALDKSRDCYTVVGLVGASDYGDIGRNRFGLAFQEAAASSGARMRNDRFETSVLEVKRDDLLAFIETLHLQT
ncbi:DNA replication initiation factor cdc45 [Malassezia yamatoensis]|uniref:Autophagy-related protein 14 n=1 Tax=Malassezia yamatoensis TaxID=253288 RepID=A0AAJ5YYE2_9BASI|nr:DNA replication initiation factor cdc45 [Malassezia yamatoensis]